jgi:serine/threonine protein kinase
MSYTGRVFKARDLNLNRLVAVKTLRKDKASEVSTRRFLREAELNGRLSYSPHVACVYDFGRTLQGVLFIVMELLHGRPLGDLIDERIESHSPFTILECIHIMSPVLRGLQAAHSHNPPIVHRDLKPVGIKHLIVSPPHTVIIASHFTASTQCLSCMLLILCSLYRLSCLITLVHCHCHCFAGQCLVE